jgi:hypothetical protein
MSDQPTDSGPEMPFRYHLELTPVQLKITHTALRSLLDDFGHDEDDVVRVIHEVLGKLPDEHAIRAIQLDRETERPRPATLTEVPALSEPTEVPAQPPSDGDDGPPDSAA